MSSSNLFQKLQATLDSKEPVDILSMFQSSDENKPSVDTSLLLQSYEQGTYEFLKRRMLQSTLSQLNTFAFPPELPTTELQEALQYAGAEAGQTMTGHEPLHYSPNYTHLTALLGYDLPMQPQLTYGQTLRISPYAEVDCYGFLRGQPLIFPLKSPPEGNTQQPSETPKSRLLDKSDSCSDVAKAFTTTTCRNRCIPVKRPLSSGSE
jgi:hypothetical protein